MSVLSTPKNSGQGKELFEFTHGTDVDAYLAEQEIKVQKAWLKSLLALGILQAEEERNLAAALDEAWHLMKTGAFPWSIEDEDIHMNLERFLVERVGEVGKRVHLGRSRNDLIATTLRLFTRDSLEVVKGHTCRLIQAICQKSEEFIEVVIPGMTHLQHGQPVRFGHALSAHAHALLRDLERLSFVQKQCMSSMPLGSAALAGTILPVDWPELAARLGFQAPPGNSYDAVGDRDFIIEALQAYALIALHLSRISEDFIIWSSTPIGLLKLPAQWSTGSSIMPNKRNPDVPELIRAKSSHIMAAANNALILMKGLPTSYNSDLHELKGVVIRTWKELRKCLTILPKFIEGLEVDPVRAGHLLERGHVLATEMANALAAHQVPFRQAYQFIAALVQEADKLGVSVERIGQATLNQLAHQFQIDPSGLSQVNFISAVEARNSAGGTSLAQVKAGLEQLKRVAEQFPTRTNPQSTQTGDL